MRQKDVHHGNDGSAAVPVTRTLVAKHVAEVVEDYELGVSIYLKRTSNRDAHCYPLLSLSAGRDSKTTENCCPTSTSYSAGSSSSRCACTARPSSRFSPTPCSPKQPARCTAFLSSLPLLQWICRLRTSTLVKHFEWQKFPIPYSLKYDLAQSTSCLGSIVSATA